MIKPSSKKKFAFGGLKTTTPKKHADKRHTNSELIWASSRYDPNEDHLMFLLELPEPGKLKQKSLCHWIEKNTELPYILVAATKMTVNLETIEKDRVYKFYQKNGSNFSEYIKPKTILITLGHALPAATGDNNIYVSCFTDWLCNETRIYLKRHNCYAYPIFGLDDIIFKDKQNVYRPRHWSKTTFSAYQITKASKERKVNAAPPREPNIVKLNSREEVSAFLSEHIGKEEILSWDLETDGLDFRRNSVGCITMAFDTRTGYFIPWRYVDTELLNRFFVGKKGVGSNMKFDIRMLRKYGITTATVWSDTGNLGHLVNENRKNGLKSLAYHYTPFGGYDEELDYILKTMKVVNFLEVPEPILCQYATMDAIVALQINEALQRQLDDMDARFPNPHFPEWTLRRYYEEIVMPWVNESAEIELAGVYVDEQKLAENSKIFQEKISTLLNEIATSFGVSPKIISSPEKLGNLLERKGWKDLGRTKKGHYTTKDENLEEWEKHGHKEAALLRQYRTWETLYSTFVGSKEEGNGWYEYLYDGKLNPEYQAMLADSHRNKCRNPNFQNFPTHDDDSFLVTSSLGLPGPNYKFLTLDYIALQIKLCAIESKDKVLVDIYKNNRSGGDLHSITGYDIFCAGKKFPVDIIKVALDTGEVREIVGHKKVSVLRNGTVVKIPAVELKEGDELT